MLEKATRKKFIEHSWVDIMKRASNSTQTWRRIRDQAIRGLNDLTLLAEKLPDDKQQEIFDNKMRDLISSILGTNRFVPEEDFFQPPSLQYPANYQLDYRRTKLAATLVNEALDLCIHQLQLLNREMPTQNNITIEQLVTTKKLCDELAYKVHMTKLEADSREESLIYLFTWDELKFRGRHRERFAEFLKLVTRSIGLHIDDFKFTNSTITCKFTIEGFYPGTAYMKRNKDNTTATLSMTIPEKVNGNFHDKVLNFELLIKNEQNRSHLYVKDSNSAKKKRRHPTIPIG